MKKFLKTFFPVLLVLTAVVFNSSLYAMAAEDTTSNVSLKYITHVETILHDCSLFCDDHNIVWIHSPNIVWRYYVYTNEQIFGQHEFLDELLNNSNVEDVFMLQSSDKWCKLIVKGSKSESVPLKSEPNTIKTSCSIGQHVGTILKEERYPFSQIWHTSEEVCAYLTFDAGQCTKCRAVIEETFVKLIRCFECVPLNR